MRITAGVFLYNILSDGSYQVLLVHPSGKNNTNSFWSIPKGEVDKGETLEAAARRECQEETGVIPNELSDLGFIKYKSGKKQVYCFVGPAPQMEPSIASWEIDQACYIDIDKARSLLHADQCEFIDRFKASLKLKTTQLFRPVGQKELDLIKESGVFPPRLFHQPIFYPVLNREYAIQIARDWNTVDEASGYVGYVTEFFVNSAFLEKYQIKTVGGKNHQEYWIPAEDLDEFNKNIQGSIVVIDEFRKN